MMDNATSNNEQIHFNSEHYKPIRVLGEGSFGRAILVECIRENTLWVVKDIDMCDMTI
jgi:NIMA (never in mitosis gene a)-related kinase